MNINSTNIKVFPFAKFRQTSDLGSRLFYEMNVSRLIDQLIDVQGFIVSGKVDLNGIVTETLGFNIKGYYFEISPQTSIVPADATDSVYARIQLDGEPNELVGQDDNNNFTVLDILGTEPTEGYYIKLLSKDSDGWKLVVESYTKFDNSSLKIDKIDGKH